jgi:hypothetical protein
MKMNSRKVNNAILLLLGFVLLANITVLSNTNIKKKVNELQVVISDAARSSSELIPTSNTSEQNVQSVLLYLKCIQDSYSTDKWLVPAMEDNSGQTFNNALTAMAFILTGEKDRAERILNFYSGRTDTLNTILNKQSFFYNGEARGFYQNVNLGGGSYSPFICDRWMGDNVWLLLAYKFYESKYGFNDKPSYEFTANAIKELLLNFYVDDPTVHGGFVRHGWRWGPRDSAVTRNDYKLHETDSQGNPVGHEEGNIDAYAAFKICGELEKAAKIKEWIDYRMSELEKIPNVSLPLDLYSWRSLAFVDDGNYYKNLVLVPENDPRFKKEIQFNGKKATGFYSSAATGVQNVWLDGLGHMVCAFYAAGYSDKAEFYSSQLDSFLISRVIKGTSCLALPYTANTSGGYSWVDVTKGFSSACAWYIFAKYAFNPFNFKIVNSIEVDKREGNNILFELEQNYPNPFNPTTKIKFTIPVETKLFAGGGSSLQQVKLNVYDVLGSEITTLVDMEMPAGNYEVEFSATNGNASQLSSGIYFYELRSGNFASTKKMILIK